jgi:pimeloyl-ACP methyl ester carboxylesterase
MPVFARDDAEIYFEEYGTGFPVLLLAPGGMGSEIRNWHAMPGDRLGHYHDWTNVLADQYRVVAMDQRNAARSNGEISPGHGWHTYAEDQLALMDYLGCERFHALGASIGCSFGLKLIETAPTRIASAVLQNPIGFSPQHPTVYPDKLTEWAEELMVKRPELDPAAVASLRNNLWRGDFVFAVDRDFVRRITVPILVMPGDDAPHPAAIGNELADILPGAECLADWIRPDFAEAQRDTVIAFLDKHTR